MLGCAALMSASSVDPLSSVQQQHSVLHGSDRPADTHSPALLAGSQVQPCLFVTGDAFPEAMASFTWIFVQFRVA